MPEFSLYNKVKFYFALAYYKLTSALECQNYRLMVFINEFSFIFSTLFHFQTLKSNFSEKMILKTKFGNFLIRHIGIDITIASPSFERMDVDELLGRIYNSLEKGHNVVFIEIGAGIGKYTISVGNFCKKYADKLKIFAFEPEPESFSILKENIQLNKLKHVTAFPYALSNKKSKQQFYYYDPMKMIVSFPTEKKISISTLQLDSFLKKICQNKNTEIFMTIDVEGHEIEVLEGSKKIFAKADKTTILVEDSGAKYSKKLIEYLSTHAKFLMKKTTYNSFWELY